jgi:hypothetical protein
MVGEASGEQRADRLPAECSAFLIQPDEALDDVEVRQAQGERSAAATRSFSVQVKQQCVEHRVISAAASCGVDLIELARHERPPWTRSRRGLATRCAGLAVAEIKPSADGGDLVESPVAPGCDHSCPVVA